MVTADQSDVDEVLKRKLPKVLKSLDQLRDETVFLSNELTMNTWESIVFVSMHMDGHIDKLVPGASDFGVRREVILRLENLKQDLEKALEDKLSVLSGSKLPRLYQLSEAVEFSDKELRAFAFYALEDRQVSTNETRKNNMKACRAFSGMTNTEFFAFVSSDRKHCEDGLIATKPHIGESYREVPMLIKKAIFGENLSFDECAALKSKCLAAILAREPDSILHKHKELLMYEGRTEEESPRSPIEIPGSAQEIDGSEISTLESEMATVLESLRVAAKENKRGKLKERKDQENDDGKSESTIGEDLSPRPFESDVDYLADAAKYIYALGRLYQMKHPPERTYLTTSSSHSKSRRAAELTEYEIKYQKAKAMFEVRMKKTREKNHFLPRLEMLADRLGLSQFERFVVLTLVSSHLMLKVRSLLRSTRSDGLGCQGEGFNVELFIELFTDNNLEKRLALRPSFYKSSRLVISGLVTLRKKSYSDGADLGQYDCTLDRMVLNYILGLECELSEIIENAKCYSPKIRMSSVILPEKIKSVVMERVAHFELFRKLRKKMGFDDIVRYGKGLSLFFHGKSGTGKTLFANALAAHMKKKVLLADMDVLVTKASATSLSEALRIIFREARMQDAIIFMDECDGLLKDRRLGRSSVALLLREMENFDGVVILATNKPQILDEAMYRRVALSLEFLEPDVQMRLEIWKTHIPENLRLEDDVDLESLAIEFELTGGFIKNAVFEGLANAVTRAMHKVTKENVDSDHSKVLELDPESVTVSMEDFRQACQSQSRADLSMVDLRRKVIATEGLDTLIISDCALKQLWEIVEAEKVRQFLTTQWGFRRDFSRSNVVLIIGPQGCGKTHAAGCLSFEIGRPMKTISMSEIFRESSENIDKMFNQAAVAGAVIVIEQGERLLMEASRPEFTSSHCLELLLNIKSFTGLIIICVLSASSHMQSGWKMTAPVPNRVAGILNCIVKFNRPTRTERLRLWKMLIPKETPTAEDVDVTVEKLAAKYDLTGARILACIARAAASAARRSYKFIRDEHQKEGGFAELPAVLTGADLEQSCETENELIRDSSSMTELEYIYA